MAPRYIHSIHARGDAKPSSCSPKDPLSRRRARSMNDLQVVSLRASVSPKRGHKKYGHESKRCREQLQTFASLLKTELCLDPAAIESHQLPRPLRPASFELSIVQRLLSKINAQCRLLLLASCLMSVCPHKSVRFALMSSNHYKPCSACHQRNRTRCWTDLSGR